MHLSLPRFHLQTNVYKWGWVGLFSSFLVGNDGNIYEGTGWLVIGAHTYGYNTNGTGIAFIGDFTGTEFSHSLYDLSVSLSIIFLRI